MGGGDRGGICHHFHPVDDIGQETRFDPLPADAFDASGRMVDVRYAALGPVAVEH